MRAYFVLFEWCFKTFSNT